MAHLDVLICTVMLKGRYYTNSFSIVQVNTETAGFKNHITADSVFLLQTALASDLLQT